MILFERKITADQSIRKDVLHRTDTLKETISMNMEENSSIVLTDEFVNKVIYDLQDFVAYVGGMNIRG
jgi:hypothetical protein